MSRIYGDKFDAAKANRVIMVEVEKFQTAMELTLQQHIKRTLSREGTGKKHKHLKYQSSAPYNPPAVQTGTLRRSWLFGGRKRYVRKTGTKEVRSILGVGSNVPYAKFLQTGTKNMDPRPYLSISVALTELDVPDLLRRFWNRVDNSLRRMAKQQIGGT